jgi:hypothetical protein
MAKAKGTGVLLCLLDELIRPVDPDDPAGLFCQGKTQAPSPTPDIQNSPLA